MVDATYPSPRAWQRLRDLKVRHADCVLELARTAMQSSGEIEAKLHAEGATFETMPGEDYQSLATAANIVCGVVEAAEAAAEAATAHLGSVGSA